MPYVVTKLKKRSNHFNHLNPTMANMRYQPKALNGIDVID